MPSPSDPVFEEASSTDLLIQHFLRRVGFGARQDEIDAIKRSVSTAGQAVDLVLDYESIPDDVDSKIGQPGYVGMTSSGAFSPSTNIADARQRWLFRMLHTSRPLQEKMTLFWHNHFATGYNKVNNDIGDGTRYMAAKASEDAAGVTGQIEMLRANALGNFSDILLNVARDVAMVSWLDGRTNTRTRPQENFAREIMELFTVGVGRYTEEDVYAGARVFTGWNLRRVGTGTAQHYEFFFNAGQHDLTAKSFTFPIYAGGSATIPARAAASGAQDGLDLITALANSPNTANYLSTKLYKFFISEIGDPSPVVISRCAQAYLANGTSIKALMRELLTSNEFWSNQWNRYAWPVEFVVRALKDFGWQGFSLNSALAPLSNMGQILFEPPDVAGWDLGQSWFSSGAMLSRINFASTLAANQRFNLAAAARGGGIAGTPDLLLAGVLGLSQVPPFSSGVATELLAYLRTNGTWTGSDAQLRVKVPGLIHLIAGSPEYQLQ